MLSDCGLKKGFERLPLISSEAAEKLFPQNSFQAPVVRKVDDAIFREKSLSRGKRVLFC